MTEPKWTPGPWKIEKWSGFDYGTYQYSISGVATNIGVKANANLIAAAPDLYAALDWVENGIPAECFRDDETTQVVFTGKDLKAFARARRKAREGE